MLKQIGVSTLGAYGANMIGNSYHSGDISKPTQLALHATLGYAVGEIGYGNGLSGGVGAVVGEVTADYLGSKGYSNQAIIGSAKLTGAISGMLISGNADGVNAGSTAGGNAAENNYLYTDRLAKQLVWEKAQNDAIATAKVMKNVTDVAIPLVAEAPIPVVGSPRENIELITGKDFYDGSDAGRGKIVVDKGKGEAINRVSNKIDIPLSIYYDGYQYADNVYSNSQKLHNQEIQINGNNVVFYHKMPSYNQNK